MYRYPKKYSSLIHFINENMTLLMKDKFTSETFFKIEYKLTCSV